MGRVVESLERGDELHLVRASGAQAGVAQGVNLRVLLELRRRLKSAAEKELAVGADRFRNLRGELRRAEAELRLCARVLHSHATQLSQTVSRTETAQARASQTCARLTSLERENEDLGQQLARAQGTTSQLHTPLEADQQIRNGTLDAFVMATGALMNELALALRDQSSISARTRDLIEESEVLSARARSLQTCYQTLNLAMTDLSESIGDALRRGGFMGDEALAEEGGQFASPLLERPQ
jgi:chromosome segregation ATPase